MSKLFPLAAMVFLAVAIMSCDNKKNSAGKDSGDEEIANTEVVEGKSAIGAPNTDAGMSPVANFRLKIEEVTESLENAQSEAQVEAISKQFQSIIQQFEYDNTPLTQDDKERIYDAIGDLFTTVLQKYIDFSGTQESEEELTSDVEKIAELFATAIGRASTLGEVISNINAMSW